MSMGPWRGSVCVLLYYVCTVLSVINMKKCCLEFCGHSRTVQVHEIVPWKRLQQLFSGTVLLVINLNIVFVPLYFCSHMTAITSLSSLAFSFLFFWHLFFSVINCSLICAYIASLSRGDVLSRQIWAYSFNSRISLLPPACLPSSVISFSVINIVIAPSSMWTEMVPFWLHVWAVGNGGWEGMLWRQRNKHVMAVWFQLYINVGIYYSVQKWWCGLLHPGMTLSSWQEVKIQEVTTRSHLFSHCNTKWGGSSGGGGGGLKQNVASFRLPIFVCLCTQKCRCSQTVIPVTSAVMLGTVCLPWREMLPWIVLPWYVHC